MRIDSASIKGHLFIIVAPSGAGKSTLIQYVLEQRPNLCFPISATTRDLRQGEVNGKEYRFFSIEQFKNKISKDEFLEYANVHGQTYYGTLLSEVVTPLQKGRNVIRHIDYQGVRKIRDILPRDHVHIIYLDAGEWKVLRNRIIERNPIHEEEIERRRQSFLKEQKFIPEADYVISNKDGEVEQAQSELLSIIDSFGTIPN